MAQGTDEAAAEQAALASNAPDTKTATPAAAPAAAQSLSESDRLQLEGAQAACRSGDFNQFFFLFAQSAAVRARYIAPQVSIGPEASPRTVSRADYLANHRFPIQALDYSLFTAASADAHNGDANVPLEPIGWILNTAGDNRRRIDWSAGDFEGGEGDGPGRMLALRGNPGKLLFVPTADCWELNVDQSPALAGSITVEDVNNR